MQQPLVLIGGVFTDARIQAAVQSARCLSIPYIFLNQNELRNAEIEFSYTASGLDGSLSYRGTTYPLNRITGVFSRLVDAAVLPQFSRWSAVDKQRHSRFQHQLSAWLDIAPARVITRGYLGCAQLPRPVQLQVIRRFFPVADALLTNDCGEALRFVRKHGGALVTSGGTATPIQTDAPEGIGVLRSHLQHGPVLVERRVPGTDIAVITLGGRRVAIVAGAVGKTQRWGFDRAAPQRLPSPVAESCLLLARALHLDWARVALRISNDGTCYCVGIESDPDLTYYSLPCGSPISHTLIQYLAGVS